MSDATPSPRNPVPQSERVKPTKAELRERVNTCVDLKASGMADGLVKRVVAVKYSISGRTVERYLRRARERMMAETGKAKETHRADLYTFLVRVMGNTKLGPRDRLLAAKQIAELLGLNAPLRHEHTGAEGGPVKYQNVEEMTDEQLHAIIEEAVAEGGGGGAGGVAAAGGAAADAGLCDVHEA